MCVNYTTTQMCWYTLMSVHWHKVHICQTNVATDISLYAHVCTLAQSPHLPNKCCYRYIAIRCLYTGTKPTFAKQMLLQIYRYTLMSRHFTTEHVRYVDVKLLSPFQCDKNKTMSEWNQQTKFWVYGSVHRWSISIIVQRDATQSSLFIILQVHSICFRCKPHPSLGVHKTVTTASGTVQLPPSNVAKLAWLTPSTCRVNLHNNK